MHMRQHAACRAAAEKRDEISSFHVSPDQGIAGHSAA